MEQIKIDLVPNGVMSVAHASQFDVGRSMKFLLTDEGVTYTLAGTEVITMKLRKPDGTDDTISLVNTSSSYVEWTTVDGDLDLSGVYLAEITITSGDDVLGTANFLLKVEPDPYNGKNIRIVTVGPADICTFETTLPEPYPSVTVNVVATGGNGTPDNPIPINGYSSANITRCGLNLWDEEWELGYYNGAGAKAVSNTCIRCKNQVRVIPNTIYYIKTPNQVGLRYYDYSGTYISGTGAPSTITTFTTPSGAYYMTFYCEDAYGTTYNNDISINYPSTDTTYHAYNGQTATIAFGQTVYGGVLDVTRGKLTVTWGIVDLGDYNYSGSNYRFNTLIRLPNAILGNSDHCLCAKYKSNIGAATRTVDKACCLANDGYVYIYDTTFSGNETAFKTAMNGVMLAYELATPFDIDLTPVQIRALVGENNVFADCGETTVEYMAEV